MNLSALTGADGFVLNGQARDGSGFSVASAGDVNGDGIFDLLIGAESANSGAGNCYVVFGRAGLGSSGSLALPSLNGTNGFVLNGDQPRDTSGDSVASAGDVNGDLIADIVIGAYYASPNGTLYAGKSYVVFGRIGLGSRGSLELSNLSGTSGFVLNGEQTSESSGYSVASAGDLNDDGIADLLIGAEGASSYCTPQAGKSYVVFGRKLTTTVSSTTTPLPTIQLTTSTVFTSTSSQSMPTDQSSSSFISTFSQLTALTSTLKTFYNPRTSPSVIGSVVVLTTSLSPNRSLDPTRSTSLSTAMNLNSPIPASRPVYFNSSSGSLTIVIALATAVTALFCSLLGGGIYFFKRKRNLKSSIETGISLKGGGPADGYMSMGAIQRGMDLARSENQSDILPGAIPENHYSDPHKQPQPNTLDHYNEVSLAQLNAEVDQHRKV